MIVLRREILVDADETVVEKKLSRADGEETNKKKGNIGNPDVIMSVIGNRISAVEAKLDATNSMLQDTLSSIMESRMPVSEETIARDSPFSNRVLEERMSKLEDKVDMMMAELRGFFSSFSTTRH